MKATSEEDVDDFIFLLHEYASIDPRILTSDARKLKYLLVQALNDNGWFQQ